MLPAVWLMCQPSTSWVSELAFAQVTERGVEQHLVQPDSDFTGTTLRTNTPAAVQMLT